MGLWREQLLPRFIDVALRSPEVTEFRKRCVEGLRGVVVEPGFGSGLNVAHYPPEVTHVYGVDPAVVGRKLAADRVSVSPVTVEHIGLDGESLPLDDDSCDAGLLTFTLCTIPDVQQALAELRRVIRVDGRLHFLEHGRSPDAKVATWQDRLTPVQRRIADGCHLNRAIVDLITDAGFALDWSDASYVRGPRPVGWFTVGQATNS
jgi:SAM-dependent methyltransferase